VATVDHNIPTTPRGMPITDPIAARQIEALQHNCRDFGVPLFDIDSKPYDIALALAKGKLEAAKVEFANLGSAYSSNVDQIKMGEDAVRVRQADFDRKNDLAISRSGTAADRDTSMANLIQAKQILEFVKWQQATVKVKLVGACHGCPSSGFTMRLGVEKRLREMLPAIKEIIQV